eukprot:Partr_v1_DN28507_c0_g1_i3_m73823
MIRCRSRPNAAESARSKMFIQSLIFIAFAERILGATITGNANYNTARNQNGWSGFKTDGEYLYTGDIGVVTKVRISDGTITSFSPTGTGNLRDFAFDSNYVYVGRDGNIAKVDKSTNAVVASYPGQLSVRIYMYGSKLYSSNNYNGDIWDTTTNTLSKQFSAFPNNIGYGLIPDGNLIYAGSQDGYLRIFDTSANYALIYTSPSLGTNLVDVVVSTDYFFVIVAANAHQFYKSTRALVRSYPAVADSGHIHVQNGFLYVGSNIAGQVDEYYIDTGVLRNSYVRTLGSEVVQRFDLYGSDLYVIYTSGMIRRFAIPPEPIISSARQSSSIVISSSPVAASSSRAATSSSLQYSSAAGISRSSAFSAPVSRSSIASSISLPPSSSYASDFASSLASIATSAPVASGLASTATEQVDSFSDSTYDVLLGPMTSNYAQFGPKSSTRKSSSRINIKGDASESKGNLLKQIRNMNQLYLICGIGIAIVFVLALTFGCFMAKSRTVASKSSGTQLSTRRDETTYSMSSSASTKHSGSHTSSTVTAGSTFNQSHYETAMNTNIGLSLPAYLEMKYGVSFRTGAVIAEGGCATLFVAEAFEDRLRRFGPDIALKVCRIEDYGKMESFIQEISVMQLLESHPNIVKILGFTYSPPSIAMKLYRHGDLQHFLMKRENAKSKRLLHGFLHDIARGISIIHRRGLVHCDLKLQNILLDRIGNRMVCVITDFGITNIVANSSLLVQEFNVTNLKG